MRIVLTIVAVALVAILSIALVAPLFIDWSAHRAEIESRLSAMTGAEVALTGPIAVRLLPTPYLEVGAGSISGMGQDAPRLSFESARLELALVKLASGSIRFSEIQLEGPRLAVSRGEQGGLRLPMLPSTQAAAVGFDRLVVKDGRVRFDSGGQAREIDNLQFEADGFSLGGPFHVSGRFAGPAGTRVAFRLASERSGPGGTPIRASIDQGPAWPAFDFDGVLTGTRGGATSPSLSGSATLIGAVGGGGGPWPWRVVGQLTADLDHVALKGAQIRFGPEERALSAEGAATLSYGSPARLIVAVKAKQANLDALLRRKGEDGVPPARAVALLFDTLAPAVDRTAPLTFEANLAAATIILGAETVSDLSASVRSAPGAPLHARFDLGLPGHSKLGVDGDFGMGVGANFIGAIDFATDDLAFLCKWASPQFGGSAAKMAALGEAFADRSASFSGHAEGSAQGFSSGDAKITLNRTTLTGSVAFTTPLGADPGRLSVDLSSEVLDVDALPNLDAGEAQLGDLDLSLSLRAKSLRVARVNETEIDSGSLTLKVTKTGPDITLDRLSVADLGGASLDARGAMGADGVAATGRLHADRLQDFALLVARLAPGEWSRTLVDRAGALSPTALAFEADGRPAAGGAPVLNSLKATGTIGQTQAALSLDPPGPDDRQVLTVSLDSSDSSALLRQFGLHGANAASGRGHIGLHASGAWAAGYDVDGVGALAGVDLSGRGRFAPNAGPDEARLFGSVKLEGTNVAPLLGALGLAPAGSAIGPIEAGADLTLRGDRWTATRLAATVAGVKATGELVYQTAAKDENPATGSPITRGEDALAEAEEIAQAPPPVEITGAIALDRLRLADLFAVVLGSPHPAKAGMRWSDAKFAAAPLNPPPFKLGLNVGALDLTDGLSAQGFSASLGLDRSRLDLDDIAMKVAQGEASGHVTLRRDKETATLTGALSANSLAIARPGFSGRLDGTLDFASTGQSAAALIDGLAGSGTAKFAGATLARNDPAALDRTVAKAQAPNALLDETNIAYAFGAELDKGPLPMPDRSMAVALTSGMIRFGPLPIARPRGEATLSASLDLRRLTLETQLAFVSSAADLKFWSGPPPAATVTVEDALEAQKRKLDVSALSAGLATQAIARESDRIAALEADIRERALFNRRLKGERFMDRRATEMEDWRAEQARLKGLTEHLAAEREAAEKAAAAKAAADKAAAQKAAIQPDLPPDLPPDNAPIVKPSTLSNNSAARAGPLGVSAPPPDAPMPPSRPKPRPAPDRAPPADPTASGLY